MNNTTKKHEALKTIKIWSRGQPFKGLNRRTISVHLG